MNIGIVLFLGLIITGVPTGIFIDWLANRCGLLTEDDLNPVLWAVLGLVWPISLLPFLTYCLIYNRRVYDN